MQPFISLKWKFICLNDWMSIFQCSRLISPHRAKYIKMNCFIVHVFSSEKLDSYWNWKWKLAWENITVSFPKLPFPPLLPKCYESFFFFTCLLLLASPLFALAEEQAQQRLQAEEAEEQYQTVLRMLNATTRKTQKKEWVSSDWFILPGFQSSVLTISLMLISNMSWICW